MDDARSGLGVTLLVRDINPAGRELPAIGPGRLKNGPALANHILAKISIIISVSLNAVINGNPT